MDKFKGTGVALVTPFRKEGGVDYNALQKLVEFQIDNGVNYLVVQGTTGESVTLNTDEKQAVLEYVIDINKKRLPIVLGVGGNNTASVVNQMNKFNHYSIDAYLSVSPYYNKPPQKGIIAHYKEIANSTDKPIILYNVPGRTSSNMSSETTLELAHSVSNIIAVKEASGNLEQIMEIISKKEKFKDLKSIIFTNYSKKLKTRLETWELELVDDRDLAIRQVVKKTNSKLRLIL